MTSNYKDDEGRQIFERVFMIIEGSPQALEIALSINLYKQDKEKSNIVMGMDL